MESRCQNTSKDLVEARSGLETATKASAAAPLWPIADIYEIMLQTVGLWRIMILTL